MKKLSLLLVLVLVFSVFAMGCGGSSDDGSTAETEAATEAAETTEAETEEETAAEEEDDTIKVND